MINALAVQTWSRDAATDRDTYARVEAFATRRRNAARRTEALSAISTNDDEAPADPGDDAPLVLPVTTPAQSLGRLMALQEWEGYVTEIRASTFEAELVDVTARRRNETERSEFLLSDLSREERQTIAEGSVFRWVIGYQRLSGGQRQRVSQLYFRKMTNPSDNRSAATKARTKSLLQRLQLI